MKHVGRIALLALALLVTRAAGLDTAGAQHTALRAQGNATSYLPVVLWHGKPLPPPPPAACRRPPLPPRITPR